MENIGFPLYSLIVILSIITGVIISCMIMYRAGLKRSTIIYTALLTFVCILVCGLTFSITLSGGKRSLGFTAAGGAIGLLIGAFASLFIHRDHEKEMLTSWTVSAPLMYGLSKTACHVTGCCSGIEYNGPFYIRYSGESINRFPVQITETICFIIIFLVGLFLFFASKNSILTTRTVVILCIIGKVSLDFLRYSHYVSKIPVSENQISACVCGIIALVLTELTDKVFFKDTVKQ